jgi:hypothetical protein
MSPEFKPQCYKKKKKEKKKLSDKKITKSTKLQFFFSFFFFLILEFELRALSLLGRHTSTWAMPLAILIWLFLR